MFTLSTTMPASVSAFNTTCNMPISLPVETHLTTHAANGNKGHREPNRAWTQGGTRVYLERGLLQTGHDEQLVAQVRFVVAHVSKVLL